METRHWTEVRLNLRNITLTPLMYIGHSRYIKIPVSYKRAEIQYQSTLVKFDKGFISYFIGELLKKLIPLHPDKLEEILSESLEYYREEWNIYQAENGGDREPDDRKKSTEVFCDEDE
ncbi:hypothetical protein [Arthrospira platensis]|nr:hypothetical protein [Arthrospira platensis]AMW31230.1 hypothetical protein AP285_28230 [Arthrospira platensis YZ]KDR54983.1 hypothetical protein APPUASWS_026030 [Arthrospira platensis str. Paraca]MBD2672205.1 hypothetical protein [Arthrospira platensis FACHB-439]MBD2713269.1 hypothetical protein [Arthrospira platensis FACHB-835]MDF2208664.1 hypothetical protein [Arthrospira platensis NCB002]